MTKQREDVMLEMFDLNNNDVSNTYTAVSILSTLSDRQPCVVCLGLSPHTLGELLEYRPVPKLILDEYWTSIHGSNEVALSNDGNDFVQLACVEKPDFTQQRSNWLNDLDDDYASYLLMAEEHHSLWGDIHLVFDDSIYEQVVENVDLLFCEAIWQIQFEPPVTLSFHSETDWKKYTLFSTEELN